MSDNNLDNLIKQFLHNVYALPEQKKYRLKRSYGKSLDQSGLIEHFILETLLPEKTGNKEIFYFVAGTVCFYGDEEGKTVSPAEMITSLYSEDNPSSSYQAKIESFISKDINKSSNFLRSLCHYIKTARRKNLYVNPFILTKDLLTWNKKNPKSKISVPQKKWIDEIIKKEREKNNAE